jgi:hypothetical protein
MDGLRIRHLLELQIKALKAGSSNTSASSQSPSNPQTNEASSKAMYELYYAPTTTIESQNVSK